MENFEFVNNIYHFSDNPRTIGAGYPIIRNISIDNETLVIETNQGRLMVRDDGQDCCESRYMTCEDRDIWPSLIDGHLISIEDKVALYHRDDTSEVHEISFIEFTTDRGIFQILNHNEHNGYYGGFGVHMTWVDRDVITF